MKKYLLLFLMGASFLSAGGVDVDVNVDPDVEDPYYDTDDYSYYGNDWYGPGYYWGIWYDNEDDWNNGHHNNHNMHHWNDQNHGDYRSSGGGRGGGGGHGGGHGR